MTDKKREAFEAAMCRLVTNVVEEDGERYYPEVAMYHIWKACHAHMMEQLDGMVEDVYSEVELCFPRVHPTQRLTLSEHIIQTIKTKLGGE